MGSFDGQNGDLREHICQCQTGLLSYLDKVDFHWSDEGTRTYMRQARQERLEAERLARISGLVTLIAPILLSVIAAMLWVWFGQG